MTRRTIASNGLTVDISVCAVTKGRARFVVHGWINGRQYIEHDCGDRRPTDSRLQRMADNATARYIARTVTP